MNQFMVPLRWIGNLLRRNPSVARVALGCIPNRHVHIHLADVGRFRIHLRRHRSLWLRPLSTLEWYPFAALKHLIRPGDIVWDVGGNIGVYARWLAAQTQAAHIYTFEPMTENLNDLAHNISIGSLSHRVTIVPWALLDRNGDVDFQIDDVQSASGAVSDITGGKASQGRRSLGLPPKVERVACRSIDSILSNGELLAPNVLKIDVEGAERMVLQGGASFLAQASPRLVIETHGVDVARSCLNFLFDLGYSAVACVPEEMAKARHLRVDRAFIERMRNQYDAHFIVASKVEADLPAFLNMP